MKINLNTINKMFQRSETYDGKQYQLKITEFVPIHSALPGLNNDTTLVDLQTRVIQLKDAFVKQDKGTIKIYYQSYCRAPREDEKVLIRVKTKKGEYIENVLNYVDDEDRAHSFLINLFGYTFGASEDLDGYRRYCNRHGERVEVALRDGEECIKGNAQLAQGFTEEYAIWLQNRIVCGDMTDFVKLLDKYGHKMIKHYHFNDCVTVWTPQYTTALKNGIEIGYHTGNTYNSLPVVVKLTAVNKIKAVKLSEIGVETRGNYSHDARWSVRSEQVKQAKRFNAMFKAKKSKLINELTKSV